MTERLSVIQNWLLSDEKADNRRDVKINMLWIVLTIVGIYLYRINLIEDQMLINSYQAVSNTSQMLTETKKAEKERTDIAQKQYDGYMIMVAEHLARNVKDPVAYDKEKKRLEDKARWTLPKEK